MVIGLYNFLLNFSSFLCSDDISPNLSSSGNFILARSSLNVLGKIPEKISEFSLNILAGTFSIGEAFLVLSLFI